MDVKFMGIDKIIPINYKRNIEILNDLNKFENSDEFSSLSSNQKLFKVMNILRIVYHSGGISLDHELKKIYATKYAIEIGRYGENIIPIEVNLYGRYTLENKTLYPFEYDSDYYNCSSFTDNIFYDTIWKDCYFRNTEFSNCIFNKNNKTINNEIQEPIIKCSKFNNCIFNDIFSFEQYPIKNIQFIGCVFNGNIIFKNCKLLVVEKYEFIRMFDKCIFNNKIIIIDCEIDSIILNEIENNKNIEIIINNEII